MEPSIFFILCLSCFLNHEIDAVRRREWRILPFLSRIDDDGLGCVIFTALHLPLFAAVIWACFAAPEDTRLLARIGLDAFAAIHLGIHVLLRNNPRNEFNGVSSWVWIVTAGLFGGIDLWLIV